MGKLYGLFYGITCNTQAGSGHYRIYVVYTGWNSFDLTLSHHTSTGNCIHTDFSNLKHRMWFGNLTRYVSHQHIYIQFNAPVVYFLDIIRQPAMYALALGTHAQRGLR